MKHILPVVALFCTVSLNIAGSQCLEYEPEVVNISGTLIRETYPGPPNYESVDNGDEPETIWVLQLEDAVCVAAADEINEREDSEKEIQLVLNAEQYEQYRNLVGLQVKVSGTLFHGHTGHHHKPLLLTTSRISKAAKEKSTELSSSNTSDVLLNVVSLRPRVKIF